MSASVAIGTRAYSLRRVHGRLFFNGIEQAAICHHDRRVIEYSDRLNPDESAAAVARAVSRAWMDVIVSGEAIPTRPEKAIASDGHLHQAQKA